MLLLHMLERLLLRLLAGAVAVMVAVVRTAVMMMVVMVAVAWRSFMMMMVDLLLWHCAHDLLRMQRRHAHGAHSWQCRVAWGQQHLHGHAGAPRCCLSAAAPGRRAMRCSTAELRLVTSWLL